MHGRKMLNKDEAQVHDRLLQMGQVVDQMLEKALRCFSYNNAVIARDVIASDDTPFFDLML